MNQFPNQNHLGTGLDVATQAAQALLTTFSGVMPMNNQNAAQLAAAAAVAAATANFTPTMMNNFNNQQQHFHNQNQSQGNFNSFQNSNNFNENSSNFYNNNNNNTMLIDNTNGGPSVVSYYQPQMMSFKQFLNSLAMSGNENSSDILNNPEQSTKHYTEYKNSFRREQIAHFFTSHKHEEWFKCRYHPEESMKRRSEQRDAVMKRLDIFMSLFNRYQSEDDNNNNKLSLDMTSHLNRKRLYKFLDAVMIRLEGGSEQDVDSLDQFYENESVDAKKEDTDPSQMNKNENESGMESGEEKEEEETKEEKDEEDDDDDEDEEEEEEEEDGENEDKPTKFNRKRSSKKKVVVNKQSNDNKVENSNELERLPQLPQKTHSIFFKHLPVTVTRQDLEQVLLQFYSLFLLVIIVIKLLLLLY
jgi:hypothetical protein